LSTNLSANKYDPPSDNSTSKYRAHLLSANSGKTESSRGLPTLYVASEKSIRHSWDCPANTISAEIFDSLSDIAVISQVDAPRFPSAFVMFTCSGECLSSQKRNIKNASDDEIFFHATSPIVWDSGSNETIGQTSFEILAAIAGVTRSDE
jgi:hypothetical protein